MADRRFLPLSGTPLPAIPATAGQVQSRVCGEADAVGALDGFWPGRTMPGSGAGVLPIAAKSGPAGDVLDRG